MRRYLLSTLGVALALALASDASAFFGHGGCGCEPSCGYAEPACGCAAEPSCGCELACDSSCDPCGKHRCGLFSRLRARLAAKHACCHDTCCMPECGCAAEPACGYAEPSCGCEADCCDACCEPDCGRRCIFARIFARRAMRGCCAADCCEPSCGCAVEPSCGCAY
ncbi:MAG TPA: hypothetical protein VF175_09720 [Lacipirellula sp.]